MIKNEMRPGAPFQKPCPSALALANPNMALRRECSSGETGRRGKVNPLGTSTHMCLGLGGAASARSPLLSPHRPGRTVSRALSNTPKRKLRLCGKIEGASGGS